MFEILGVVGIAISVAAYVPQVVHLAREHCSAGVSSRAWTMWLAGGVLVGLLAVQRGDPVFILLQLSSLTSSAMILLLARRYRGMACETHRHLVTPPGHDDRSAAPGFVRGRNSARFQSQRRPATGASSLQSLQ
jgi:lipid-A-disaccharide synthase-like uncharacterized protein